MRSLAAGFLPAALELADAFTLAAAFKRTGSERLRGARPTSSSNWTARNTPCAARSTQLQKLVRPRNPCSSNAASARTMRGSLADSPRILLRPARHRPHQVERGHRRPARPAGGPVRLRRAAAKETRPAGRLLRPRRRRQHPHERHGGFQQPGAGSAAKQRWTSCSAGCLPAEGSITGEHGMGLAKKRWWP